MVSDGDTRRWVLGFEHGACFWHQRSQARLLEATNCLCTKIEKRIKFLASSLGK